MYARARQLGHFEYHWTRTDLTRLHDLPGHPVHYCSDLNVRFDVGSKAVVDIELAVVTSVEAVPAAIHRLAVAVAEAESITFAPINETVGTVV